jgi:hypothetical protein
MGKQGKVHITVNKEQRFINSIFSERSDVNIKIEA